MSRATWTPLSGHSSCWSRPVRGASQRKSDGLVYTPYTWTYSCDVLASDNSSDGRLRLGGFRVRADFAQSSPFCTDVTYWTQRSVVIDNDGAGPQRAETLTYERRNGTRGPYTSGTRRMAAPQSTEDVAALPS
ncbi:hypothetical protein NYE39_15250 [Janibacter sp. FSL W8-0316]|uniref:hypothetical protein n=1 Tax=Janibacter sp. FSL W8-0316 TaxID=2975325 RepID=UPI0030FC81AC